MKKFSFIAVILVLILSIATICFADESGEIITIGDEEALKENQVYLNDYDEYINALGDDEEAEDELSEEDYKQQLKAYYDEYQEYLKEYYTNFERQETEKAEVVEAGETREEYTIDYTSQGVAKYVLETVKVKVLPGEKHSGEELELDYILTADSLNNIVLSRVEKGDIVFITIDDAGDGTLIGNISNSWSTVRRVNKMLIVAIIAVLLLLIYGGKKGFTTSLVVIMTAIFAIFIIPTFANDGNGVIAVGILEIICLIFTMCAVHLGMTRNSAKAMFISTCLTVVAFLLILFLNYITRTVGVTFEFAAIAENVIMKNINFEHLYYIITLIVASAFITNTTCMAVKRIDRENSANKVDRKIVSIAVLPANIIPFAVTSLSLYIPNHILLLTNKFGGEEIINSETLISELIRIIACIICMILVVPMVSMDIFKFDKKYLDKAKEPEENKEKAE